MTDVADLTVLRVKLRHDLDEVHHPNRIEIDQDDLIRILDALDELDKA